jgi:hypothetical protein
MAYTMQAVLDRARVPLNDADKVRYPDADGLVYANDAVKVLKRERPDLFFGQFEALPGDKTLGQDLPVADEYVVAVTDYVTARWEFRDDEAAVQAKASAFFGLFKTEMGV